MLGPTLQEFELVPVTDPAQLAALDRRYRVAEKAKPGQTVYATGRWSENDLAEKIPALQLGQEDVSAPLGVHLDLATLDQIEAVAHRLLPLEVGRQKEPPCAPYPCCFMTSTLATRPKAGSGLARHDLRDEPRPRSPGGRGSV
jgi:hypothetical protein